MKPAKDQIARFAMKILYIGLLIDVGGAVALFIIGMLLENRGMISFMPEENIKLLGYILLGVSVVELLLTVLLKRKWLNLANLSQPRPRTFQVLTGRILVFYIILFVLALSPAIYGFLYFVLSGMQDMFTLMACLTLIGYMMVRPRPEFIERLVESFDFETV